MKKLLLLLLVGSTGVALAVNRDVARRLLERYDEARRSFIDMVRPAEGAFAHFSNAVADLFVMDIGLEDPAVKGELEELALNLDTAKQDAWAAFMNAAVYSSDARRLRNRLAELAR